MEMKRQVKTIYLITLMAFSELSAQIQNPVSVDWDHKSNIISLKYLPTADVSWQSSAILVDVDNNKSEDIIIAGWGNPSMVLLRRDGAGWKRYIIDDRGSHIEAGGASYDIDGDGDLDIVQGGSWATNEVWWWENPYPDFDPDKPWNRYTIKNYGEKQHHDQIIGDFDGDGMSELVFWNQADRKLLISDIPYTPKEEKSWVLNEVWSWPKAFKYEGLAKADIDLDGKIDIVGGGMWFKHNQGSSYEAEIVDDYGMSRSAAGDLIEGGRPEIVLCSGDGIGALNLYEWNENSWTRTTLIDTVDHGHTLQVGDLNGDGKLDIYTAEMYNPGAGENARQYVLYGDGRGKFTTQIVSVGIGTHEGKIGDLDGDGDLDILQKDFKHQRRIDIWINPGPADLR